MSQAYFPHQPEARSATPIVSLDRAPYVVAANGVAAWLFEIVGPFFWVALLMMFVLAAVSPQG
jgi:hypothetical protein